MSLKQLTDMVEKIIYPEGRGTKVTVEVFNEDTEHDTAAFKVTENGQWSADGVLWGLSKRGVPGEHHWVVNTAKRDIPQNDPSLTYKNQRPCFRSEEEMLVWLKNEPTGTYTDVYTDSYR